MLNKVRVVVRSISTKSWKDISIFYPVSVMPQNF